MVTPGLAPSVWKLQWSHHLMAAWCLLVKDAEIFLELLCVWGGVVVGGGGGGGGQGGAQCVCAVWTQCLIPAKMEQSLLQVVCSPARAAGTSGEPAARR